MTVSVAMTSLVSILWSTGVGADVSGATYAVAVGLGIGVVPRAMVSSGGAGIGLTAVPLSAERGTRALTVVYRENDQTPTAANEFIEALRSAGASASTPVFIRTAR